MQFNLRNFLVRVLNGKILHLQQHLHVRHSRDWSFQKEIKLLMERKLKLREFPDLCENVSFQLYCGNFASDQFNWIIEISLHWRPGASLVFPSSTIFRNEQARKYWTDFNPIWRQMWAKAASTKNSLCFLRFMPSMPLKPSNICQWKPSINSLN